MITCRGVFDATTQADRSVTHVFAKHRMAGKEWTWSLLDHLLVPSLDAAFALAHVNHVANSISKDLLSTLLAV